MKGNIFNSLFNTIRVKPPKRNNFNLSHGSKLTTDLGILTPILCEHVLPGDTWSVRTEELVKMMPMKAPILHQIDIYSHYFYIPFRLIWEGYKDFVTGGENGDSVEVWPTIKLSALQQKDYFKNNSLADYLDFPTESNNTTVGSIEIDALPFRAYQLIYNEYYRDQNLTEEIEFSKSSGPQPIEDIEKLMSLRYRAWQKDYFTSALPWTQRGEEVRLPINGSNAQLQAGNQIGEIDGSNGISIQRGNYDGLQIYRRGAGTVASLTNIQASPTSAITSGSTMFVGSNTVETINGGSLTDLSGQGIKVNSLDSNINIDNIQGPTINEFRRSLAVQKWKEASARGGSRYIEYLLWNFGVKSSDARLQRPQYLGGGKQPLVISELLQTSQTTEQSPQGTQTGNGISLGSSNQFKYFFEEDGFVIGLLSIVPKPAYQQGMPRKYLKRDRFDIGNPFFAHLGEQEIKMQELYFDFGDEEKNNETFGYTPRYAEYKFINDKVHGEFRGSMDYWHLGRIFGNAPKLNEDFITVRPEDANRIFPVEYNGDDNFGRFYVQLYHHIIAKRPLPRFGTPTI